MSLPPCHDPCLSPLFLPTVGQEPRSPYPTLRQIGAGNVPFTGLLWGKGLSFPDRTLA